MRCENIHAQTNILAKSVIFYNTPAEKWFSLRIFELSNFLKKIISIIWKSLNGGENPSYNFFFSVTDRQNAKP